MAPKTVGFFMRNFTGRGVERSTYDYAHYNETILGNKSYIFAYTLEYQASFKNEHISPTSRHQVDEFKERFGQIIELNNFDEVQPYLTSLHLDFFYIQRDGCEEPVYRFGDKEFWGRCKTIMHCVFTTNVPQADYNLSISQYLNMKYTTEIPVLPLIVSISEYYQDAVAKVGGELGNMRLELGIPEDAIVFGRYGGHNQFNIPIAHNMILHTVLQPKHSNIYFIFMNTDPLFAEIHMDFYHPNIRYLPFSSDMTQKIRFINTCDAMIHARYMGETFGLAVAEFSSMNKPVITSNQGDIEHILILREKALVYANDKHLYYIFTHFKELIQWNKENDWNAYRDYTPEKVMQLFDRLVFSKEETSASALASVDETA
jgi:glycosyltransferase involved in cell wall biosynthesis